MPAPDNPKYHRIWLRFGAGLATRKPETQIDPLECADGENFDLDIENAILTARKPFDLVATATNNGAINGYAQLVKADGSITTLIQAGTIVYSWDGSSTFTQVGTVVAGAKLRGPRTANWLLDDIAIITDIEKFQPVMQWDGTTFSEMSHNLSGKFYAAYCTVANERAIFGNVTSGTATPHMIVASKRSDNNTLSISVRPASGVGLDDPWFLLMPDFQPINGLLSAFGRLIFSTRESNIFELTGNDATDFALSELFAGSGASGDEAFAYVGNDVVLGRRSKIERLATIVNLGDVESDDLTREIANLVKDVNTWTIVFDPRTLRTYCFGEGRGDVLVYHQAFGLERPANRLNSDRGSSGRLSGWSRWTTDHALGFQPQTVWQMLRPTDGIPHVYMGGADGAIYQLDGSGPRDGAEGTANNALTGQNDFTSSAWSAVNGLTVSANAVTAPDGTLTADKLIRDTGAQAYRIQQSVSVTTGVAYRFQCYLKAGEVTWGRLAMSDAGFGTNSDAFFNLSAGTIGTIGSGLSASNVIIKQYEDDWYLCSIERSATATTTATMAIWLAEGDTDTTFPVGNATDGLYAWGAVLRGTGEEVVTSRTSGVIQVPSDADLSDFKGYVHYRKKFASSLNIDFLWGGERLMDTRKQVNLEAATGIPVYGGGFYYNNDTYYGTQFNARLTRQVFTPDGQSTQFQVKVENDGSGEFAVESIVLEFRAKKN